jgi:hypothetical protein
MAAADDYHQYARECLESAARAKTEIERWQFLNMARAWTEAALQLGGTAKPPVAAAALPSKTAH